MTDVSDPPQVEAGRARPVSVGRVAASERVRNSLSVVPVIGLIAGWVLARVLSTRALNEELAGWIDEVVGRLSGDERSWVWFSAATLQTVTATVAAAMLTFVGVVFSLSILALQVASSQLSPRIMRTFVRSRVVTCTLAVFLATFVYALTVLSAIQPGVNGVDAFEPFIAYYVLLGLVAATLAMFVAYVSHVVHLIRIHHILDRVAAETRSTVVHAAAGVSERVRTSPPDISGTPSAAVVSEASGVVDLIGIDGLARLADQHRCVIELRVRIGDHVSIGQTLARLHSEPDADPGLTGSPTGPFDGAGHRRVRRLIHLGAERTMRADPAFGLRQIVDVAIRALSPAVNDPTTAVQALDRIAEVLAAIGTAPDQPAHWLGPDGDRVRVVLPTHDWDQLVDLALTEIVVCGVESHQVTRRVVALLDDLTDIVPRHRLDAIERWRTTLRGMVPSGRAGPDPLCADRSGLG